MANQKMEYSKRIVLCTGIIFVIQVILASFFSWYSKDTSIFSYTIPTSGGIFGAAVAFYLNKAKMENVCKGKIKLFEYKMNYLSEHPEHKEHVDEDLSVIDDAIDSKINEEIHESITEDIDIQSY